MHHEGIQGIVEFCGDLHPHGNQTGRSRKGADQKGGAHVNKTSCGGNAHKACHRTGCRTNCRWFAIGEPFN